MSDGVIAPNQTGVWTAYTVINAILSIIFLGLLIWLIVWLITQTGS